MDAITKKIYQNNLPLTLKGGTALLFGYKLDRMSLDLDFDANKHINLESVIKESFLSFYGSNKLILSNINLRKDTDDVKRYMIDYKNSYNNEIFKLKIEMSFRRKFDNDETNIINSKRIFKLPFLFDFKKAAFENRTASRDLHDIIFIGNKYAAILNQAQIDFIKNMYKNINNIIDRYSEAYKEDTILKDRFEEDIIMLEQIATNKFNRKEKGLPNQESQSPKPDDFSNDFQNRINKGKGWDR
jgi:predicted nucleotidyltransferase component of viral defense system